ncbi:MAG: hypothetical protein AAFQ65_09845, partial [Myxococcota bacterium]
MSIPVDTDAAQGPSQELNAASSVERSLEPDSIATELASRDPESRRAIDSATRIGAALLAPHLLQGGIGAGSAANETQALLIGMASDYPEFVLAVLNRQHETTTEIMTGWAESMARIAAQNKAADERHSRMSQEVSSSFHRQSAAVSTWLRSQLLPEAGRSAAQRAEFSEILSQLDDARASVVSAHPSSSVMGGEGSG